MILWDMAPPPFPPWPSVDLHCIVNSHMTGAVSARSTEARRGIQGNHKNTSNYVNNPVFVLMGNPFLTEYLISYSRCRHVQQSVGVVPHV